VHPRVTTVLRQLHIEDLNALEQWITDLVAEELGELSRKSELDAFRMERAAFGMLLHGLSGGA